MFATLRAFVAPILLRAQEDMRIENNRRLVGLLQAEQAELCQIEALLAHADEVAATLDAQQARGQRDAGVMAVMALIEDQLAARRAALGGLDAQIAGLRQCFGDHGRAAMDRVQPRLVGA